MVNTTSVHTDSNGALVLGNCRSSIDASCDVPGPDGPAALDVNVACLSEM